METSELQPFNPIQLHLLKMFAYNKNEESLNEVKDSLLKYYQKKADDEISKIWREKNMSNNTMQDLKNAHFRTPYKLEFS